MSGLWGSLAQFSIIQRGKSLSYLLWVGTWLRLSPCIVPAHSWGQATCASRWQRSPCGRRVTGPPHPCCPFPVSVMSPCLFSWKLWAEYFQMLEYFQICRLIEIHVIYVWKWSRWTWHLILCWSNALNFNLCSATCFFTLSKPQQLSAPKPTHLFEHIWWCDPLQLTHILRDCCKSALACDKIPGHFEMKTLTMLLHKVSTIHSCTELLKVLNIHSGLYILWTQQCQQAKSRLLGFQCWECGEL